MKSRIQSKTALNIRRPTNLDAKTWKSIESIFKASQQAQRATGRFKFYPYLVEVYRTCTLWKRLGVSREMAHRVAKAFKTPRRKGTTPVRTLIDATFPALDTKRKSRWSRALELAAMTKVTPEQVPNLFKNNFGIAGCARGAAKQKPKKETNRDDWAPAAALAYRERRSFQSFPISTAMREGSWVRLRRRQQRCRGGPRARDREVARQDRAVDRRGGFLAKRSGR
jgi:hypothetical protein